MAGPDPRFSARGRLERLVRRRHRSDLTQAVLNRLFSEAQHLCADFGFRGEGLHALSLAPDLIEALVRIRVRVRRRGRNAGSGHPPGRPGSRKSRPHRENPVFLALSARLNRIALADRPDDVGANLIDCVLLELHGLDVLRPDQFALRAAARRARRWVGKNKGRMPDMHLDYAVAKLAELFEAGTGQPASATIRITKALDEKPSPCLTFIARVWPFVVGLHEPVSPEAIRQRLRDAKKRDKALRVLEERA